MIRNIIFDVGRVLVEFDYMHYLDEHKYSEEEKQILLDAVFNSPVWLLADRGPIETEELVRRFVANAPEHEDLIREAYAHVEEVIWEKPYAKEWVADLKSRGYRLYVLSNYGKDLYERTVDKMPFLPYMDGVLFSYQCHLLKPEWEIYQMLCNTYEILPGESVFIDDNMPNIEAARAYGIHAIHFTGYEQASKQLEELLELYDEDDRMVYCCE